MARRAASAGQTRRSASVHAASFAVKPRRTMSTHSGSAGAGRWRSRIQSFSVVSRPSAPAARARRASVSTAPAAYQ
jgi:hypothetical protein